MDQNLAMSLAGTKAIFINKSAEESGTPATVDDYVSTTLAIEKKDSVCRKRTRSSAFFGDGEIDEVGPLLKRSKNYSHEPVRTITIDSTVIANIISSLSQMHIISDKDESILKIKGEEQNKVPCKATVISDPLKSLQPSQKRATQPLLVRAVTEANEPVVLQEQTDFCLEEKKTLEKSKITNYKNCGEKIILFNRNTKKSITNVKVENKKKFKSAIRNESLNESLNSPNESSSFVKSLFKRSNNEQKFVVTLNDLNNDFCDDNLLEDEPYIESQDSYKYHQSSLKKSYKRKIKNVNILTFSASRAKYRKISSRGPRISPALEPANPMPVKLRLGKRSFTSSNMKAVSTAKTSKRCRFWPNCRSGSKCAFVHPTVLCKSFPNCKFEDKCSYKHPNCKFGTSCTKMKCKFTHPRRR
uniref:Zinc finger CCCH domain-containing protein 14 n=1 Tax=Trichogramma kaykai TaxID=54128 RepID=A0ABD2XHW6_9HYME